MTSTRDDVTCRPGRRTGDEGSVLVLVLVLMVVGALVVVPTMRYAISVLRANEVLSDKTAKGEAVKAGFRMAMAEPVELYETCGLAGLNTPRLLPSPGLDIPTISECYLIENNRADIDGALPYGLATTHLAKTVPTGAGIVGSTYPGPADPLVPTSWLDDMASVPTAGTVWVPHLPVHGLSIRTGPRELPGPYVINGYTTCRVYFPGTYKQPVVVDSAAYFTSGIYYFEDEVRVVGGADVVVGQGIELGCADDQQAAFYAVDAPATHNINGLGATFVFGDAGRLVIDDSAGPVTFRMNQRYVAPGDDGVASSARVSIMTVNGDLDEALVHTQFDHSGTSLFVADQIAVPLSLVGTDNTRPAPVDEYRPSTLTPESRVPDAPVAVTAHQRNGALVVAWEPPPSDGGSPITGYVVTGRDPANGPAGTCSTSGPTACLIDHLTNGTDYRFWVVAINANGQSEDSEPSPAVRPNSSARSVSNPGRPNDVRIVGPVAQVSAYRNAFEIAWQAPTDDGGAPIDRYEVVVRDELGTSWTCETDTELSCVVDGPALPSLGTYRITVRARNMKNLWSPTQELLGCVLDPIADAYVAPPEPPPPMLVYEPAAVLDVVSTSTGLDNLEVRIPGYIAVPQGVVRVAVADPAAAIVRLTGGALTAWFDIVEPRPNVFTLGIENPTTQRRIRVVTRLVGDFGAVSDAVVQVNETGGWAVNSWEVQTG